LSVYFFPLYVVAHLCISGWAIYLARVHKAPGALPVAIIATGLIYDNLIISLGASIGIGPLLQNLSLPRFAMHALLTPFLMIAASQIAAAGGIRWAQTSQWRVFIWVLVLSMVVLGIFESLVGLETVPACFDGILRYTPNLSPTQFCYEGQEAVRRSGPPIPSIVGNVVTLVIGFFLWRHNGWVWLMVGALIMFVAAAVPFSVFGMAPGNGGEVLLLFSYVATVARFGRFRKSAAT
jgi:hypothetical protein